jgi:hypothetical protein
VELQGVEAKAGCRLASLHNNAKAARMAQAAGKVVTPHVSGGYASYNMLLFCAYNP